MEFLIFKTANIFLFCTYVVIIKDKKLNVNIKAIAIFLCYRSHFSNTPTDQNSFLVLQEMNKTCNKPNLNVIQHCFLYSKHFTHFKHMIRQC